MSWRVLAICGAPGAGKSTLCAALAARLGARRVEFDAHERMTHRGPEAIRDWLERGAPVAEVEAPGFTAAIRAARAQGPVLVEAPLGRAWPPAAPLIDRAVWIDCPADLALARKLGAIAARARGDAGFADWARAFLEHYGDFVRPVLELQARRVRPLCDLVVEGTAPVERIADEVLRRLGPAAA